MQEEKSENMEGNENALKKRKQNPWGVNKFFGKKQVGLDRGCNENRSWSISPRIIRAINEKNETSGEGFFGMNGNFWE